MQSAVEPMGKRATNIFLLVLAAVILIFLIATGMMSQKLIGGQLTENVSQHLVATVDPAIVSFEQQIDEQIKKVKTMAAYFSAHGTLGDQRQVDLMRIAVEENGLLRCTVADVNGDYITHDGQRGSVRGEDFFENAVKGEFYISDPEPALVGAGDPVIFFSSPIERGGKVSGVLIYSYLCTDMDRIFKLDFMHGKGYMMVINQSGEILLGSSKDDLVQGANALRFLQENCLHDAHAPEECAPQELGNLAQTIFAVQIEEERRGMLADCEKLKFKDWYILALAPIQAVNEAIFAVSDIQQSLIVVIFICVLLYLLVFMFMRLRLLKRLDQLTKLPRLEYFKMLAGRKLRRNKDKRYIFVRLDVRNLKLINRAYSFQEGDRVLQNMATAFRESLKGQEAIYARVDKDVFVAMIPYINREKLEGQRQHFLDTFKQLMGADFTTHITFPTGQYITDRTDAEDGNVYDILEKTSFAHSLAKRQYSDVVVDYENTIEKEALLQKEIEDKMDSALQNNDYKLYLQPKFHLADGTLCGAEALVRWCVDGRYVMHPAEFIPALERNGFIVKLDMYMFEQAVLFIRKLLDKGLSPVPISVNFSRHHLNNDSFVKALLRITQKYGVSPRLLELELTESTVFENVERIMQMQEALHEAGFRLSMDDFGSGYSSLGLLKDLTVDVIKIDRGFFSEHANAERNKVVLSHVFAMARELKTETVAEGVELEEQVDLLRGLGCDIVQGFYFSMPMPSEGFRKTYFTN